MSCDTKFYPNISIDQMEQIREKAQSAGLALEGDSGDVSSHGVTLRWSYLPATSTLTIACIGKPFFVSCDHVNDTIKNLINEALAVPGGPQ